MSLMDNFLGNVRIVCEKRGISQRELSRISGVHYVTICRILGGSLEPSVSVCEKIATALNINPEKIFHAAVK